MSKNNLTGMGDKTNRRFNKIANDMRNFANSTYEYDAVYPTDDYWHDYHGRIRSATIQQAPKHNTVQSHVANPTVAPKPSPLKKKRRASRKNPQ